MINKGGYVEAWAAMLHLFFWGGGGGSFLFMTTITTAATTTAGRLSEAAPLSAVWPKNQVDVVFLMNTNCLFAQSQFLSYDKSADEHCRPPSFYT